MEAQIHIRDLVQVSLILLGATILYPAPTFADFQLTKSSGVYEESRGTVKVIIASTPEEQGIFVMVGPPLASAEFSLDSWTNPLVESAYIRFNQGAPDPHYAEVVTKSHRYGIDGNLSIQLGDHATIGIDNNNTYLTVEFNDSADFKRASVLGFSGLNEIVREYGEKVPLVSASSLDDGGEGYALKGGLLYEGGVEISGGAIGKFVRLRNECLNDESLVLLVRDVRRLQEIPNQDERSQLLKELIDSARVAPVLRGYLVLSAVPEQSILLDPRRKSVHRMMSSVPRGLNQKVCVITDVAVGEGER